MWKTKLSRSMGWLAAALGIAFCGISATSQAPAAESFAVGGIIYARDSEYWQLVQKGMTDAAKDFGVTLQLGLNRRQLPTEAQVIEDFTTRGVKAIVLPPLDRQASATAAQQAKNRGIVIVTYDAPFNDAALAAHEVGADAVSVAAQVSRQMRHDIDADLGGKASLGVILVPPTNPNMKPRRTGLSQGLGDAKVDMVGEVTANTPEQGATAFETLLQRNPATQMVWVSNAGALQGAATAAKRSGSKARLYGLDLSREIVEMLLDPASPLQAVSDQQPYQIGYKGVEAAVKTVRGEALPYKIPVESRLFVKGDTKALNAYIEMLKQP